MGKLLIKNGPKTKQLLKAIPKEDIQILLDAYDEMKNIQLPSFPPDMPNAEFAKIAHALERLFRYGYITQKERLKINTCVVETVMDAKNGTSETNKFFTGKLRTGKRGQPPKHALDILCSALIYMIRAKTATDEKRTPDVSHLKAIAGFLCEQNITSSSYFEYLKKGNRAKGIDDVLRTIDALGSIRKGDIPSIADIVNPTTGLLDRRLEFNALFSCLIKYKCLLTGYLKSKEPTSHRSISARPSSLQNRTVYIR